LPLGAVTPPEIAFSIMGEIMQLRRSQTEKAVQKASAADSPAGVVSQDEAVDPVCGMTVQVAGARYTSTYRDQLFAFCCLNCQERFDREPERYQVRAHA
jgi:YHS domain-containing protein